jgi:hypothetical protein
MKNLIAYFTFILFVFAGTTALAQDTPYLKKMIADGVEVDYKWSHTKLFNKTSPLELRLRFKNTNEHAVKVVFSVDFYMNLKLTESSEDVELCILPGKWKTGRTNGVYFQPENLTNKQIRSDDFHWEINEITVEITETCTEVEGEEEEG